MFVIVKWCIRVFVILVIELNEDQIQVNDVFQDKEMFQEVELKFLIDIKFVKIYCLEEEVNLILEILYI